MNPSSFPSFPSSFCAFCPLDAVVMTKMFPDISRCLPAGQIAPGKEPPANTRNIEMCYRVLNNIHYAEPNQILLSLKGKKPHINRMKIYFAEFIDTTKSIFIKKCHAFPIQLIKKCLFIFFIPLIFIEHILSDRHHTGHRVYGGE